jgi:S1-C subfamily serine protease
MRRFSLLGGVCLVIGLMSGYMAHEAGFPKTQAQPPATPPANPSEILPQGVAGTSGLPALPLGNAAADDGLLPEERVSIAVYEKCNRSVVHIATRSVAMDSFLQVSLREGSGSGSVLDQSGMILTNYHVIDGAKEISVSLFNGLSYSAMLVGQDPDTDIAVLKIDAPRDQLLPVTWGDSQTLRVGQRIYAIGNPFGLERTMSTGMISSLNRQVPARERRTMRSLIQIDAALNQGNSGGPLLGTRGQLIGMNTAIMSTNGDSAGVGFAIPVSTLKRIVPQLIQNGRVIRPTIGITRVYENEQGLLIVSVAKGGPADRAGLQGFSLSTKTFQQGPYRYEQSSIDPSTADLIQSVDGQLVQSADDLLAQIETKRPGETITLGIVRAGERLNVAVTLGQTE